MQAPSGLGFLEKLGFQDHGTTPGTAFNLGGRGGEANVLDQRAALERLRRASHFEVFNERDRVAFGEQGTVAVFVRPFRDKEFRIKAKKPEARSALNIQATFCGLFLLASFHLPLQNLRANSKAKIERKHPCTCALSHYSQIHNHLM